MRSGRQAGFTLIEVVAAFALFAVAFGAVLQVLNGALRNNMRAAEYTQAALWAQSKLDAVGYEPLLEEGTESGDFNAEYSYSLEITAQEAPQVGTGESELEFDIPIDLYRVALEVTWRDGTRSAQFVTWRSTVAGYNDRFGR